MLGHLRTHDAQLFEQLAQITGRLSRSTLLLARLLEGPDAAAPALAAEVQELRDPGDELAEGTDVRSFTAFAMRLDRMEYRDLAVSLDAALSSVQDAMAQATQLHASAAETRVCELARALADAAALLERAVPQAGRSSDDVRRCCAEIRRHADAGAALYYAGVESLVASSADVLEVLRWKQIYDVLQHALARCAETAVLLEWLQQSR